MNKKSRGEIRKPKNSPGITPTDRHERLEAMAADIYEKINKALKSGQFDNELRQNIMELDNLINGRDSNLATKNKLLYLKIKCRLAEAYDYFGQIESSDKLLGEGATIFDELRAIKDVRPEDREIVREQIRFCLNHTYAFLYRAYKYSEAEDRTSWCLDFVASKLHDEEEFPCYGTLAQAEFYLGHIHRRLNQYDEAEDCFGRAIEYYYKRAKRKKEEYEDNESVRETMRMELTFSDYKVAICLGNGLGRVSFTRGHLKEAIHYILPARVLLLGTEDQLHTATLDLLYGSAKRSIGGRKEKKGLLEAIKNIESAYQVFQRHNHVPYIANAALELSLAYLYNDEHYKALSKLTELESILKEDDKAKWKCPTLLMQSRISREMGNHLEARRLASEALDHANNQVPYQIEALIVRSEARIILGEFEEARDDLREALKLNEDGKKQASIKVEAVCHLHFARSYAREHDGQKAEHYFEKWKQLEKKVEHGVINELALDVGKEISSLSKDFVIRADTKSLNYNEHLKELQKFLVSQAKKRTQTIKGTTEELSISRQTLHQWQKEMKS